MDTTTPKDTYSYDQLILLLSAIRESPDHPLFKALQEQEIRLTRTHTPTPITALLKWLEQTLEEHPEWLQ